MNNLKANDRVALNFDIEYNNNISTVQNYVDLTVNTPKPSDKLSPMCSDDQFIEDLFNTDKAAASTWNDFITSLNTLPIEIQSDGDPVYNYISTLIFYSNQLNNGISVDSTLIVNVLNSVVSSVNNIGGHIMQIIGNPSSLTPILAITYNFFTFNVHLTNGSWSQAGSDIQGRINYYNDYIANHPQISYISQVKNAKAQLAILNEWNDHVFSIINPYAQAAEGSTQYLINYWTDKNTAFNNWLTTYKFNQLIKSPTNLGKVINQLSRCQVEWANNLYKPFEESTNV